MKKSHYKKYSITLLLIITGMTALAQDLTGYWVGVFNTDMDFSGKRRSFRLKMELEQTGKKVKGIFSNALLDFPDDPQVIYNISGKAGRKDNVPISLIAGTLIKSTLPFEQASVFLQFDDILYTKTDTAEYLSGKWLPNGSRTPRPDGAGGTFWVRRVFGAPKMDTAAVVKTFAQRKKVVLDTVSCNTSTLTLSMYDNGIVDGDSIAVYINGVAITEHQLLSVKPVSFTIPVEKGKQYTISLFAENLGRIPPNTALLKIEGGGLLKEILLSSTFDVNASVLIKVE